MDAFLERLPSTAGSDMTSAHKGRQFLWSGSSIRDRATIIQKKTKRPVQFEVAEQTKTALAAMAFLRSKERRQLFVPKPLEDFAALVDEASMPGLSVAGSRLLDWMLYAESWLYHCAGAIILFQPPVLGQETAIERQTVGILRDHDLSQKRFRRNAALNDVHGCGCLNDTVFLSKGIPWPAGDDDPELRRYDVQSFRDVFSDQHLLLAGMLGQFIRLDYHLDPLQVGCKALARPRLTLVIRMRCALCDRGPDRSDADLDLLKTSACCSSSMPEGPSFPIADQVHVG